jgi:NADPH-dependent 7-cyano-7-deazaguanine reductase QueF
MEYAEFIAEKAKLRVSIFKILSAYRNHNLTSETTKSMIVEDILRKIIKEKK